MTWVRIDDEFEDNAKVAPLSDGAHRVWLMANCWCKKPKNFHTHGFVPAAMLPEITHNRYKPTQLKKLAQELVEATVGGTKKHGLWELREGGWQFHDWKTYLSKEELKLLESGLTKMSKSEAGSLGGNNSVSKRRERDGTAQPRSASKQPPKQNESASEATTEAESNHSRSPDPDPVPLRSDNTLQGPVSNPTASCERSFECASSDAKALFDVWQRESGKTGVKFDWSCRQVFEQCVREGVTLEDVRLIVRGAKTDEWAVKKARLMPSPLFKDPQQRAKFLDMARNPDPSTTQAMSGKTYPGVAESQRLLRRMGENEKQAVPPPADVLARFGSPPPARVSSPVAKTRPEATSEVSPLVKPMPVSKPVDVEEARRRAHEDLAKFDKETTNA